jgi:hypothetical protein
VNDEAAPMVLVLTDTEDLRETVDRLIRRCLGPEASVSSVQYARSDVFLTPARIESSTFFVLDLLRRYPGGLRAEGVALAERLVLRAKRVLVFSPLSLADEVRLDAYWDLASPDTLGERVAGLISRPVPPAEQWDRLVVPLRHLLRIPPQHPLEF